MLFSPECDPDHPEYSVCWQCCGGDGVQCDFSQFETEFYRNRVPEDWADRTFHGFLTGSAPGVANFDPLTFPAPDLSQIEFGNPRYHAHNSYQNQNSYRSEYRNDEPESKSSGIYRLREPEEVEPTTTEFPTTARTTTYQYETTEKVLNLTFFAIPWRIIISKL